LILVVDDLHLADEASLSVLHLVLRRSLADPLIAILTAREGELSKSAQANSLRHSMSRLHRPPIILAPLNEQHTGELLTALCQHDDVKPNHNVRKSLMRASGGFPMVLELLVQDWRANGSSTVALALDAMTTDFCVAHDPALAYGQLLSRLTGAMEPMTRSALDLASVLGHRLNDLGMYSVIDLSLGQTMVALGQLSELRVLREGDAGLEFANELVRANAYAAIPSSVRKALHASVADRLLHSDQALEPTSRLEIAWHTMRAGRQKEAVPHLLEGAAQAMRSGAPQSATRALSSALTSLHDCDLVDATCLLVEALQEQGLWRDSLDAIASLDPSVVHTRAQELFAFASLAEGYLGSAISSDIFERTKALKSIVQTCEDIPGRLRAARAAAYGVAFLRNRALARDLLALLDSISRVDLNLDEQGMLDLIRAMLLYQAGELESSFEMARSCLEELRHRGRVNSVTIQLQTGLGALRGRQGRYEEAIVHQLEALSMAQFVGNDALASYIAANVAIAYGRVGRHEEQLRLALENTTPLKAEVEGFVDLQLAYSVAFAHGMLGRPLEARKTVAELDSRLNPRLPSWIIQPWLLWKADVLMIAGCPTEAFQAAHKAIDGFDRQLQANAFAGSFARWLAMICANAEAAQRAPDILRQLEDGLEEFDRIDQVEILCANAQFSQQAQMVRRQRIAEKLRSLPPVALSQLRALGMRVS
jgi:tetratricopeptide (TPR) repeat protein